MLEYCGGSQVDKEGHYIAGGVWSHAKSDHTGKQYQNLPIAGIMDPEKGPELFRGRHTPEEMRELAQLYRRNWREMMLEFENLADNPAGERCEMPSAND